MLQAAIAVADAGGLASLTIRSLAHELGVRPMSVYHYVAGKDEILDAVVDLVYAEIDLPEPGGEWKAQMRRRARSARSVLARHPWSIALLQSRLHPGPATLRHHDAVIGTLLGAGFSLELTAHAYAVIDSYVFGFALSDVTLPVHGPATVAETAEAMLAEHVDASSYPHLVAFTTGHVMQPGYDFGAEFGFGLDLVLDGLEAALTPAG